MEELTAKGLSIPSSMKSPQYIALAVPKEEVEKRKAENPYMDNGILASHWCYNECPVRLTGYKNMGMHGDDNQYYCLCKKME